MVKLKIGDHDRFWLIASDQDKHAACLVSTTESVHSKDHHHVVDIVFTWFSEVKNLISGPGIGMSGPSKISKSWDTGTEEILGLGTA